MSPSTTTTTTTGLANLQPASEFYRLGLLLSVSTAINREDAYPTFSALYEEKFLWREAKKPDNFSTVIDEAIHILILDHQILAGMAAGVCALVVANISSKPVINQEGEVYPGLDRCEVRSGGVDHWAQIKTAENGWGIFLLDNRITLPDHVTTLNAYLNDYRMTDNESDRKKMSSLFSDYITAACWKKMYYRMTHWATLGLIKNLAEVQDRSIIMAADWRTALKFFNRQGDSRLARRLMHLEKLREDGGQSFAFLEKVMTYHPNPAAENKLSVLLSKCRVDSESPVLYTQDTVLEFQRLLVATLIAYGSSLTRIYDATDAQTKQEFGNLVSVLALLLSTIVNSNAFACHLHFLNSNGLLPLPTFAAFGAYYDFAATCGFGLAKKDPRHKNHMGGSVNAETEPNADGGGESREAEMGDDDNEDPNYLSFWSYTKDAAADLGDWMKTFVSHYSAQRSLERHCSRNRQEEVKITLLEVGSEYRKVLWEDMKQTITATIEAMTEKERPSIATVEVIKCLEDKIKDTQPTDKHAKNIFWIFRRMISGHPVQCLCRTHCEAALAALSLGLFENVSSASEADKQALADLVGRLNQDRMAVSKLCCPFCWIFLQHLRGEAQEEHNFSVRGHHSTLYAIDLPGKLPEFISQGLINKLRGYVGQQLKDMVDVLNQET